MAKQLPKTVTKRHLISLYRQAIMANVPIEDVDEKIRRAMLRSEATSRLASQDDKQQLARLTKVPRFQKYTSQFVPVFSVLIGFFLIGSAVVPISQTLLFGEDAGSMAFLAPIPNDQVLIPQVITQANAQGETASSSGAEAADTSPEFKPTIVNSELDFTNLSNWFPNLNLTPSANEAQLEYSLDIPELDIANAKIKVGGSNLDHNLIQYPGTSLPGQPGSPVIFGHSVLRQFYNPSINNPRRYFSIFSKIMTLKTGDKIFVTYDNVKYTYIVKKREIVKPEDIYILEQAYDGKRLKLVTCYPEGTYLQRGVITAEIATGQ